MKVLAFVTQKGGTGKSSLAVSLAVAAQEQGLRVHLIDLDPQQTSRNWYERREASGPEVSVIEPAKLSAAVMALRRQGFHLAILDTPGVDTPAAAAAMQVADLCLIPARPSVADIEAAKPTIRSLTRLSKAFAFVLNQCPAGRTVRNSDAYRALTIMGAVTGVTVALRTDHVDAMALGQGVTERDPQGKAAAEIRDLLQWTILRMELTSYGKEAAHVA